MEPKLLIVAALAAFTTAATVPAQQRKAETRLVNGNVEARIVEPNGVDHYFVFQGVGINGPVEIPATLANCASPVFFTIGPLAAHNHQHTIDWLDCQNVRHRWSVDIPVNSAWLSGSALAVASAFGFGCGLASPVDLAIDADPVLGTTRTMTVSSLPAGTTVAATYVSTGRVPGWGYSLSALGINAAECYVFLDLGGAVGLGIAPAPGSTASFPLPLPSARALTGVIAYAQAAALSPGQNAAGIVTSNAVAMVLAQ